MKKSIVLLITLIFIGSISLLILKNLDDSEQFFEVLDTNNNLAQTKLLIDNTNNQLITYLNKQKDSIDDILDKLPPNLPLQLTDNISINLHITPFYPSEYININDINQTKSNADFKEFVDFKYLYFEILNGYLKDYKQINSFEQIDKIVDQYISQSKDTRILNIKDRFIYHNFATGDNKYIKCSYDIKVSNLLSKVQMIFCVGKKQYETFRFYFRNTQ